MSKTIQGRGWVLRTAAIVLLGAMALPGQAAELPASQCADIRAARDALISLGVVDDMQRGPQWAGNNLAANRLARIRQYVTAEEQVLFRCDSIPRDLREGMRFAVNVPAPKPFYDRRTFPLPVRKPNVSEASVSTAQ